jgi:hypothetical protein
LANAAHFPHGGDHRVHIGHDVLSAQLIGAKTEFEKQPTEPAAVLRVKEPALSSSLE